MQYRRTMVLVIFLAAIPVHAQLRTEETTLQDTVIALQGQVERLQKQMGAVQAQLANQVCFSKSAYGYALNVTGNLSIAADAITVHSGGQLAFSGNQATLQSQGTMDIKAAATMTVAASGLLNLTGATTILNGGSQRALAYETVTPSVTWTGTGTTLPILVRPSQSTVLIP